MVGTQMIFVVPLRLNLAMRWTPNTAGGWWRPPVVVASAWGPAAVRSNVRLPGEGSGGGQVEPEPLHVTDDPICGITRSPRFRLQLPAHHPGAGHGEHGCPLPGGRVAAQDRLSGLVCPELGLVQGAGGGLHG